MGLLEKNESHANRFEDMGGALRRGKVKPPSGRIGRMEYLPKTTY